MEKQQIDYIFPDLYSLVTTNVESLEIEVDKQQNDIDEFKRYRKGNFKKGELREEYIRAKESIYSENASLLFDETVVFAYALNSTSLSKQSQAILSSNYYDNFASELDGAISRMASINLTIERLANQYLKWCDNPFLQDHKDEYIEKLENLGVVLDDNGNVIQKTMFYLEDRQTGELIPVHEIPREEDGSYDLSGYIVFSEKSTDNSLENNLQEFLVKEIFYEYDKNDAINTKDILSLMRSGSSNSSEKDASNRAMSIFDNLVRGEYLDRHIEEGRDNLIISYNQAEDEHYVYLGTPLKDLQRAIEDNVAYLESDREMKDEQKIKMKEANQLLKDAKTEFKDAKKELDEAMKLMKAGKLSYDSDEFKQILDRHYDKIRAVEEAKKVVAEVSEMSDYYQEKVDTANRYKISGHNKWSNSLNHGEYSVRRQQAKLQEEKELIRQFKDASSENSEDIKDIYKKIINIESPSTELKNFIDSPEFEQAGLKIESELENNEQKHEIQQPTVLTVEL